MSKYKELKQSLNKNYKEMAVCIVKDYIKYGSYYKVASVYGVTMGNLSMLVKRHSGYIEKQYPEVYKEFIKKREETSRARYMAMQKRSAEARSKEGLLHLNNRSFKELPKKVKYIEFLDWCCKYDTKDLRGTELVNMAERNGITVVG